MNEYLINIDIKSEIIHTIDQNIHRTVVGLFRMSSWRNSNEIIRNTLSVGIPFANIRTHILGALNER
jgi:hypothetical protein